ncbi:MULTISPECIES: transposase [Pseudoalteromonas]|uniref:transposase n=1 Tax=Pseudoalteromonas TaxID=53246 RepID=UPI001D0B7770|nr:MULTISPECIES: transposase [Pseudoalteromonas]WJE08793.1 transposase [Pseudoalteromonas sp. JC3]
MSWNDLRKGRISIPYAEYFITFNCHKRTPYFTDYRLARLFCQSISHNEQKFKCCWQTWVLMPDHFHGLLTLGNAQLGKVVGELKGRTAYLLNTEFGKARITIICSGPQKIGIPLPGILLQTH